MSPSVFLTGKPFAEVPPPPVPATPSVTEPVASRDLISGTRSEKRVGLNAKIILHCPSMCVLLKNVCSTRKVNSKLTF